ncbi:MAG: hypothetical protein SGCHY_004407, partial [Lobulomycetales sp.]
MDDERIQAAILGVVEKTCAAYSENGKYVFSDDLKQCITQVATRQATIFGADLEAFA